MKNHLKIIIFGPSEKFLSGITYYTIRLSNALSERADVTAILFRNMLPQKLFPGWKRVGASLSRLSYSGNVTTMELIDWYNPLSWLSAYRTARNGDVIIFQWWTSSVAFMYFFIAFLNFKRVPLIIEYHEVVDPLEYSNIVLRSYSRTIGLLLRKLASHFIVHSEADKDLIIKTYRISEERIDVVPHGLYDQYIKYDNKEAKKRLSISEENVILFFGLIRPYKGLKYLIKAFELFPESFLEKTRLFIAGEPWEDRESVELITASPVRRKITLIGRYVNDDEISTIFSAADVLVVPYTRASQSGVTHIGMSFGLPIIATDVGGIKEGLQGYNGTILIEPKNQTEIKDKLIFVLTKKEQFSIPENLKWDKIVDKWLTLLLKIREF